MLFNINDCVKVKLTPRGIEVLQKRHAELKKAFPQMFDFRMPKIDSEGYTEYQLWDLMQRFGNYVGMGMSLPFETTIDIVIPESK